MMRNFFLVFLFIASSNLMALDVDPGVSPRNCLNGEWHLDNRKSDNPQKIKDKLLRKYKQQQRAAYRPKEENIKEISLPAGMPAFIFVTDPLFVSIETGNIVLKQKAIERNVNTLGQSSTLSLKNLNNQGGATVAGWENKMLVVETTAIDGTLIVEKYQLQDDDHLLVSIDIDTTVSKPIEMVKIYQRESKQPENCTIP